MADNNIVYIGPSGVTLDTIRELTGDNHKIIPINVLRALKTLQQAQIAVIDPQQLDIGARKTLAALLRTFEIPIVMVVLENGDQGNELHGYIVSKDKARINRQLSELMDKLGLKTHRTYEAVEVA